MSRDHAGKLAIEETDHMAKKGTEVLGGVGLVVGLFAPPHAEAEITSLFGG